MNMRPTMGPILLSREFFLVFFQKKKVFSFFTALRGSKVRSAILWVPVYYAALAEYG